MLAVVIIILGAVVPEVRRLVQRVLKVPGGAEKTDRLFAIEEIHRHAKVGFGAAERVEFFLMGDIEQWMQPVVFPHGDLLGERGCEPGGEVVGGAALFAHAERGAGLEIDRAAQRIRPFVRRVAFGELELVEH